MNKSPIKVLHICQRDDPATGGAVRVAIEYVTRLQNHGIDAHCLFLYGPPGYFQTRLKERAHYLGIRDSKEIWKFGRLLKFLKEFDPQIVHHHDGLLWPNLFTIVHPNYRKVIHAHLGVSDRNATIKGAISAWCHEYTVDAIVCISKAMKSDYLCRGGYSEKTIYVIRNGVDQKVYYPPTQERKAQAKQRYGWDQDTPVIGYVGRLECKMKGVDDFIRVLGKLPSHIAGLVVGDGPDRNYLEILANQHNLEGRVHFSGTLTQTYLAYTAMDVFCLTSHWEPFGLVAAEAIACQISVVRFPCLGGVNEILNDSTGYVLAQRSPELMATVILDILKTGISMSKRKNIQHKLLTDYCWDRNTGKLASLYQDITQ